MPADRPTSTLPTATRPGPAPRSNPLDPACPHVLDRPFLRQQWDDVAFAHWPVPAEAVAERLPAPLAPDLHAGSAWVSLVTFRMRDLRVRHLPRIPTTSDFAEVNVRTYVDGPDGPGVWFSSLDASSVIPVLVARTLYGLPYCVADIDDGTDGGAWTVARRWPDQSSGTLLVAPSNEPADDDLSVFLTARWRLYAGRRVVRVARIEHEPWPLRTADVRECDPGLVRAAGFRVEGAPIGHWAHGVSVRAAAPTRLDRRVRGGSR